MDFGPPATVWLWTPYLTLTPTLSQRITTESESTGAAATTKYYSRSNNKSNNCATKPPGIKPETPTTTTRETDTTMNWKYNTESCLVYITAQEDRSHLFPFSIINLFVARYSYTIYCVVCKGIESSHSHFVVLGTKQTNKYRPISVSPLSEPTCHPCFPAWFPDRSNALDQWFNSNLKGTRVGWALKGRSTAHLV